MTAKKFVATRDKCTPKKYRAFVTPYTEEEYREMKAKFYLSETGKSGFALKPDGDIISVFAKAGSEEGFNAMIQAIASGGRKLDCFEGFLSEDFYPDFGFEEYNRLKWNDKYMPEGWDKKRFDEPDVVLMRRVN